MATDGQYMFHSLFSGYFREMQALVHPLIIPINIHQLVQSYYDPWTDLAQPPTLRQKHPHPMYYYSKPEQKGYLILCPGNNVKPDQQCMKYDILKDEWIAFTKYPAGITAMCHNAEIDQDNELLYITHGFRYAFAIYNLRSNKWEVLSTNEFQAKTHNVEYTYNAASCIASNSELHLLVNISLKNYHIKYDSNVAAFEHVSENAIQSHCYLSGSALVFVKSKQWLMAIGGYMSKPTDKIWYTQYKQNERNYAWTVFPLTLPAEASAVSAVVVWDSVLIAYDRKEKEVWIMDLGVDGDGEYRWSRPVFQDKERMKDAIIVLTHDYYLHFVNCYNEKEMHQKLHLSSLIPPDIYSKYIKG